MKNFYLSHFVSKEGSPVSLHPAENLSTATQEVVKTCLNLNLLAQEFYLTEVLYNLYNNLSSICLFMV
jgi:hypothetical protein